MIPILVLLIRFNRYKYDLNQFILKPILNDYQKKKKKEPSSSDYRNSCNTTLLEILPISLVVKENYKIRILSLVLIITIITSNIANLSNRAHDLMPYPGAKIIE